MDITSYTAYHRAVNHSAYDRNFLENQLRGSGGGRSGRLVVVDPVVVVLEEAVTTVLHQEQWQWRCKSAGYSSYTAYHETIPIERMIPTSLKVSVDTVEMIHWHNLSSLKRKMEYISPPSMSISSR